MAQELIIRIARISDNQVVKLFEKIAKLLPDANANFGGPNNLNASLASVESLGLPRNSHMFKSASLSSQQKPMSIIFARGISQGNFGTREPSAYFDEIQVAVNPNQSGITLKDVLEVTQIIESFGTVIQPNKTTNGLEGATDIISAEVAKLAALAAELTANADAARKKLEADREQLATTLSEKLDEFESQYQAKDQLLSDEKAALEAFKKDLDDREHKHVRRQLRETITDGLVGDENATSGLGVGSNFNKQGMLLSLLGAVVLVLLAFQTQLTIGSISMDTVRDPSTGGITSSTLSSSPQVYLLYFKLFATSAAAFGMLVYLISWMRRLATDATNYQQQQRRYAFDMNRASWAIETILELSDSDLTEIPDIWLESVTRDLFSKSDAKNEDTSSLQALGALLNVTSEAEIGPDGPKFKINRRGAKKAASDAKEP